MLNNINLIGRLTHDPVLRHTANNIAVCNFSIAVERAYVNSDGERDVDFIPIVVWRKQAEHCSQYLSKGRLVSINGRIQVRRSESEDRTYYNTEVIANPGGVHFLDWSSDKNSSNDTKSNISKSNDNQSDNMSSKSKEDPFDVPF
ncbi:MAG: single-stranded DNA-binding protein [bacterium]